MAQISDPVLALINQAESDLAAAVNGDASAATLLSDAQTAKENADAAQSAALQLHTVATQSSLTALAALMAELQLPPGTTIPPVVPHHFATILGNRNPIITRALNLGINWGAILSALLKGGLAALQALIGQVSSLPAPAPVLPPAPAPGPVQTTRG